MLAWVAGQWSKATHRWLTQYGGSICLGRLRLIILIEVWNFFGLHCWIGSSSRFISFILFTSFLFLIRRYAVLSSCQLLYGINILGGVRCLHAIVDVAVVLVLQHEARAVVCYRLKNTSMLQLNWLWRGWLHFNLVLGRVWRVLTLDHIFSLVTHRSIVNRYVHNFLVGYAFALLMMVVVFNGRRSFIQNFISIFVGLSDKWERLGPRISALLTRISIYDRLFKCLGLLWIFGRHHLLLFRIKNNRTIFWLEHTELHLSRRLIIIVTARMILCLFWGRLFWVFLY